MVQLTVIKAKDCSICTSFRVRLRAGSKAVAEETNKFDFRKKVKNATKAAEDQVKRVLEVDGRSQTEEDLGRYRKLGGGRVTMNTLETPEGETDKKVLGQINVHIVELEEKSN